MLDFFISGSSRYLQESAYTTMPDICHIIDSRRAKAIFSEWTRLILEEMDNKSKYMSSLDVVYDTYFEEIYNPSVRRNLNNLFSMWCLYHIDKDMWFGFRNTKLNGEIDYSHYIPHIIEEPEFEEVIYPGKMGKIPTLSEEALEKIRRTYETTKDLYHFDKKDSLFLKHQERNL